QKPNSSPPEWTARQNTAWLTAQVACLLMLAAFGWLLARLVWLYYFFGLFFFLVAGLLVGAISFRLARSARPVEKARLVRGIVLISFWSILITINWEYRHFAATVGQPPKFAGARNAAVAAGRPPSE